MDHIPGEQKLYTLADRDGVPIWDQILLANLEICQGGGHMTCETCDRARRPFFFD